MNKQKMVISFSGGRTSAYMTKWLLENKSDEYEFLVIFANTGQEHEKTLEFIKNCDDNFGFNTVWVEAVVHHGERKSNGFKIVDFQTAARNGEPFEQIIKKHGIPNQAFPHCTRELKLAPITSYANSVGFGKKDAITAIGIRADEKRRVSDSAIDRKIVYPLVDIIPTTKFDILCWWEEQDFDLGIEEHHGNCTWCWKKSEKKHMMLISEMPEIYDFPRRMEELYPNVGAHQDKSKPRVFFRRNQSVDNLFKLHELIGSQMELAIPKFGEDSGCSESCELFEIITKND